MQPLKKQSFLHGAAVLVLATVIVKLIGACYKIPLGNIIDDAGFGYFNTAYDVYNVLLTISTTGLPVAMSRMISEAQALESPAQIRRIYKASLCVFLPLGVVGTGGMLLLCRQLAALIGQPNAWASIAALSPAVFFICVISSYRGFFQGQSNMTPTSVSQVIEALFKLILGLGLAWFVMDRTNDVVYAAAASILGVTIGTAISAVYLGLRHRSASAYLSEAGGACKPLKATVRQLLSIAVPITVGAAGLQLINLLDTMIFMRRLMGPVGLSQLQADDLKGIYNFCQTIFNLPGALIVPITVSVIPSITNLLTVKDESGTLRVEESAVRITALVALPCGVGLAVLARPILVLLRGYGEAELATAVPCLILLGCAVIFNCLVLLTNAIMQAHGNVTTPVVHMLVGGVVKVIANYFLVAVPPLNIVGAPMGTLCCYILITVLNLLAMRRMLGDRCPRVARTVVKPLAASAVMGGAAWAAAGLLGRIVPSNSIVCLGAIALACLAYLILVLALRIITMDDCMLLPKGEKIAKVLKIK